jgi:hypothetical protein
VSQPSAIQDNAAIVTGLPNTYVVHAYGWTDLLDGSGLSHHLHETHQGIRCIIGLIVCQEILGRLLELNHALYAGGVQSGLHATKRSINSLARRCDAHVPGEFGMIHAKPCQDRTG